MKYGVSIKPKNPLDLRGNLFTFTSQKKAIAKALQISLASPDEEIRVIRYRNRIPGEKIFSVGPGAVIDNLKEKILEAKRYETKTGNYCYVIFSVPMNCYLTTTKMPLLGEWYDADGVQHGRMS